MVAAAMALGIRDLLGVTTYGGAGSALVHITSFHRAFGVTDETPPLYTREIQPCMVSPCF